MDGRVRGRGDGYDLHAVHRAGDDGAAVDGGVVGGEHGLRRRLLRACAHRVGACRGGSDRHRSHHQASLDGNLGLAVQALAAAHVDDVGGGVAVADVGVAVAIRPRARVLLAARRPCPELRRHFEAQRHEVVGVVHVVEFGGVDDLRLAVERGVRKEVQIGRSRSPNSLNGMMSVTSAPWGAATACRAVIFPVRDVRRKSLRGPKRTLRRQPGKSFSS